MVFDKIGKALGKGAKAFAGDVEVIKWPEDLDPEQYIAWRYPKDVIRWGSVVIVDESQRAVFLRDGKLLGILGPGRHVLDTQNVPFLQGVVEGLYGESIFRSNIVFVNLRNYENRFGDRAFIDAVGVHLLFNGVYYYTVDENRVETFYAKFMGVKSEVTPSDVKKRVDPVLIATLQDAFAEYATEQMRQGRTVQNFSDFMAMLGEFSEYAKARISQKLNEMFGLRILDITLRVDISEEDKRILQMSGPRAFAAMYERMWAGRERISENLAKAEGGGAVAPFVMMPWVMYPPPGQPGQPQQAPMTPPVKPGQQPPPQYPYPPGYPYYPPQPYPQQYPQPYPPPQQRPPGPQAPQPAPYPQQPWQRPPAPYQYPPQPWQAQPAAPGQQPQQAPQTPAAGGQATCPYCGRPIPPFAPVCPYCAQPIKWCPDGRPVRADSSEC